MRTASIGQVSPVAGDYRPRPTLEWALACWGTKHAPTALGVGIKTWVIGAPGSEVARATLSNLAVAGGTRRSDDCTPGTAADPTVGNCHYDMTTGDFQSALATALDHILAVVTCRTIR